MGRSSINVYFSKRQNLSAIQRFYKASCCQMWCWNNAQLTWQTSIINQLCPLLLRNVGAERWLWGDPGCVRELHSSGPGNVFKTKEKVNPLCSPPSPPKQGEPTWHCLGRHLLPASSTLGDKATPTLLNQWCSLWEALIHAVWCSWTPRQCAEFVGSLEMYKPRLTVLFNLVLNLEHFCMSLYRVIHSSHCLS
jgi:hypothetical protein